MNHVLSRKFKKLEEDDLDLTTENDKVAEWEMEEEIYSPTK